MSKSNKKRVEVQKEVEQTWLDPEAEIVVPGEVKEEAPEAKVGEEE